MKKPPPPKPPPPRRIKNIKLPKEDDFRIVEFGSKFYIEQRVTDCIPLIMKRKIWVRIDDRGQPKTTHWNYRMPQRPEAPDMVFNSLQHARNWLRTPKIKTEPIYHRP